MDLRLKIGLLAFENTFKLSFIEVFFDILLSYVLPKELEEVLISQIPLSGGIEPLEQLIEAAAFVVDDCKEILFDLGHALRIFNESYQRIGHKSFGHVYIVLLLAQVGLGHLSVEWILFERVFSSLEIFREFLGLVDIILLGDRDIGLRGLIHFVLSFSVFLNHVHFLL